MKDLGGYVIEYIRMSAMSFCTNRREQMERLESLRIRGPNNK